WEYQAKLCRAVIGNDDIVTNKPYNVSNKDPDGAAPYGRLMFHADMMWADEPFQVLSLQGLDVTPGSATTSLASAPRAWDALPTNLKDRVANLDVVQITGSVYKRGGPEILRPEREEERSVIKKIAQRHMRTGETILYVSQQNSREIVGMDP